MSNFHISLLEWQSRSQAVMERSRTRRGRERGREEKSGLGRGRQTGRVTNGVEAGKVYECPILGQGIDSRWMLALSWGSFTF